MYCSKQKAVVFMLTPPPNKNIQHMHLKIPSQKLFDSWSDPVVHLLLLESSISYLLITGN